MLVMPFRESSRECQNIWDTVLTISRGLSTRLLLSWHHPLHQDRFLIPQLLLIFPQLVLPVLKERDHRSITLLHRLVQLFLDLLDILAHVSDILLHVSQSCLRLVLKKWGKYGKVC